MKILITGASGLLGRALMKEFSDYHVLGTYFTRQRDELQYLDLCDEQQLQDTILSFRPNIIIYSVGERRPMVWDNNPSLTYQLNAEAPARLARICSKEGIWLLYISTDYVFNGTTPPYYPTSSPCPINLYGHSKVKGEELCRLYAPDSGILRIPVLYGKVEYLDETNLTALLKGVQNGKPVRVDNWARRYPTLIDDVAFVCRQLVEKRVSDGAWTGIWHWSASDQYTKYNMALKVAEAAGLSASHIEPDPTPADDRPFDCRLDCSTLNALGIGRETPLMSVLEEILAPWITPNR